MPDQEQCAWCFKASDTGVCADCQLAYQRVKKDPDTYRRMLDRAERGRRNLQHVGVSSNRTHHVSGSRERLFADAWQKTNKSQSGYNGGYGTLELLLDPRPHAMGNYWHGNAPVSQRDAQVAATVVQWFGSNCGWFWLTETVEAAAEATAEQRKDQDAMEQARIKERAVADALEKKRWGWDR